MKNLSAFLLMALSATVALGQTVSYTYDNMGNRTARVAGGTPPATNCYTIQLPNPPYDRKLTNVSGIVKVKPGSGGNNQIWQVESVGAQVRITSFVSNSVLGVASGGNSVGDLVTLQPSGPEDYKLWTRVSIPNGGGLEAIKRKNSNYLMGSWYNWGNGDPSDAVTDIKLSDDPSYTYGSNKWMFTQVTCPTARTSAEEIAETTPLIPAPETTPDVASPGDALPELMAAPNPSNGAFEANFYVKPGERATLSVNDMTGRERWRKALTGEGNHRETVSLPEAAAGTYLLVLRREGAERGPAERGPTRPLRAVESKRVLIVR